MADCIADRNAAEARLRIAKATAARADEAKIEATLTVERLKQGLDRAQIVVTQKYAKVFSAAFRAGSEPPSAPVLPKANSVALTLALTRLTALHTSACELATEAQAAADAVAKANAAVVALADEISIDAEYDAIEAEAIANFERGQRLFDRMTGIARRDERRAGGPRLYERQANFLKRIDRRQAAIAKDPLNIEEHIYRQFRDAVAVAEERASEAHARRLAEDPQARFEESSR